MARASSVLCLRLQTDGARWVCPDGISWRLWVLPVTCGRAGGGRDSPPPLTAPHCSCGRPEAVLTQQGCGLGGRLKPADLGVEGALYGPFIPYTAGG